MEQLLITILFLTYRYFFFFFERQVVIS